MGLENSTYISGLNASNPVHATDPVSEGDDHMRLIKSTLLNTFPNINAAMNASPTELNYMVGVAGKTGTGSLVLHTAPTFNGQVIAGSFSGSIAAANINSGSMADARIPVGNVTQHQAALSLTESQISDLQNYLTDNDTVTTLHIGNTDTTLSRDAAGQLAVEGDAVFTHDNSSYASAKVFFSTSAPTGGNNGDVWYEHEA